MMRRKPLEKPGDWQLLRVLGSGGEGRPRANSFSQADRDDYDQVIMIT